MVFITVLFLFSCCDVGKFCCFMVVVVFFGRVVVFGGREYFVEVGG